MPMPKRRKRARMIDMAAIRYTLFGSEYIGAYASATEKYVFTGRSMPENARKRISSALNAEQVTLSIGSSDIIGIFMRANSNGILLSNLASKDEVEAIKKLGLGINVGVLDSILNAVGNNILANDKLAFVNPEYDAKAIKYIADILDVEVFPMEIGAFHVLGSSNILTNKGMAINNHATDSEKKHVDKLTGFDSLRATANFGSLGIGLSVIANSHGAVVGGNTSGYEFANILNALNIN